MNKIIKIKYGDHKLKPDEIKRELLKTNYVHGKIWLLEKLEELEK